MDHGYWVAMAVQLKDDQWTSTKMHSLSDKKIILTQANGEPEIDSWC